MKKIKGMEHMGIMPPPPLRDGEEPNQNPVKLCHDVTRLSRAKARETNIDGVMSQPGARLVLAFLAYADGVTQRELVERTHLQAPTVSVILARMEEEGLAERRRNSQDKRQMLVYITEKGKETDRQGLEKIKETDAIAISGLEEAELAELVRLLRKMRDNLHNSLFDKKREQKEREDD